MHIKNENTVDDLWMKLKQLFDDSGFTRKISLLRTFISIRLDNRESMTKEWIGSLLLTGLPEKFAPMIMAIEHSGIAISADVIKTKLLDMSCEVGSSDTEIAF